MQNIISKLISRIEELENRVLELENKGKRKSKLSPSREKTKTSEVFDCYAEAFRKVYQTEPARNGMVNRLIQNLIGRIGLDEAKKLSVFYLEQRDAFYTKNYHPIKLMVHNCEGLLTRMQTNQKITSGMAQKIETQSDNQTAVNKYLERKHLG